MSQPLRHFPWATLPHPPPRPIGFRYSLPRPFRSFVRGLFTTMAGLACLWMLGYPTATAEPPALQLSWGAPAPVARGGWGRMIRLGNGDWLAVSTRFARPPSTLQLLLSKDAARTWTAVGEVSEPGRLLDNGDLIRLRDGTLLLSGRSLVTGESYRLPVYRSSDAGKTWSLLSTIDANEGAPGSLIGRGLWEPHFYQLADGRLAAAYANEKHAAEQPAYSQVCSVKVSADGGESWGREIALASEPKGGKLRPGMPVVERMGDGRFIAVYEIVGMGDADVFYKISRDGEEWPAGLGKRIPGHHAGPWVTALAGGRLLLTSCSNTLSYSDDNGLNWHPAEPPAWNVGTGKHFTWPAIYQTGANEVAAMVSWQGVQVRFGTLGNRKNPTLPTP